MKHWKWFKDCKTFKEGKKKYRKLVMEYHPDRGGASASDESMKEISNEYQQFLAVAIPDEEDKRGEAEGKENASSRYVWTDKFFETLEGLSGMNVEVEVIGEWIWAWDWSPMDILNLTMLGFVYSKKYGGFFWFDPARPPKGSAPEDWTAQDMRDKFGSQKKKDRGFI